MRIIILMATGAVAPAWAQTVDLPWSARLLDATGAPITGDHAVRLGLWDAETGGTEAHATTHPVLSFRDGYASATLQAVPTSLLGQSLWLEVSVDGTPLSPRTAILPVPVAARALVADTTLDAPTARVADVAKRTMWVDFDPAANLITDWAFQDPTAWSNAPDTAVAYVPGYPGMVGPAYGSYTTPQQPVHRAVETGTSCYEWAVSNTFPIDRTKAYEFSIWIYSNDTTLNNYLGFYAYTAADPSTRISGSWNNPYFKTSEGDPPVWTRWSGIVLPDSFPQSSGRAVTNLAETNGVDWVWPSTATHAVIRFGTCYGDGVGGQSSFFALPMVRQLPLD